MHEYQYLHFSIIINRSDYAEGWYQDENGDWYQADPTEGKKPTSSGKLYIRLKSCTIIVIAHEASI